MIVIHELGYVDTSFPDRCKEWRTRGIKVLEDCAHVAGVSVGSGKVGDFGDAALFSLCKVIPAPVGGLLRTRKPIPASADGRNSVCCHRGRRQSGGKGVPPYTSGDSMPCGKNAICFFDKSWNQS